MRKPRSRKINMSSELRPYIQAVMRPDGLPRWVGPAEPGSVHDVTAARWHALPALYRAAAPVLTPFEHKYIS